MKRSLFIAATLFLMGCNVFFSTDSVTPPTDGGGNTSGATNGTNEPMCGTTTCAGDQPVCDVANETCVDCVVDDDCGWRRCEPESLVCVDCLADDDCNGNRFCTQDFVCEK